MNCWVTETNDTLVLVEQLDELGEVRQRAGQAVDLIDDDHVDLAGPYVLQEPLQGRAVGIAAGEAAVVVFGPQQGPSGMGLAADIGLRGIILGVERVEVLLEPLVGRDAGIDRAANRLRRSGLHDEDPFDGLSRRPKNFGPFQRVPVIAKATFDRLG